jgi:hypothetical protein
VLNNYHKLQRYNFQRNSARAEGIQNQARAKMKDKRDISVRSLIAADEF